MSSWSAPASPAAVCARRMAEELGLPVLVIDRRPHIAGNAYDTFDEHGVLCHRYGPAHLPHQPDARDQFLSRFTEWRPYEHRVAGRGRRAASSRCRSTARRSTRCTALRSADEAGRAPISRPGRARAELRNSEDAVVAKVGRDLYERLFRGYTRKQWALDPTELARLGVRADPGAHQHDDRYFTDSFQQMPADGYTAMFERMLDHPRIEVRAGRRLRGRPPRGRARPPRLDRADRRLLRLPLRAAALPQPALRVRDPGHARGPPASSRSAQVNYPHERIPYTRVTEFRQLTGQAARVSTLAYEYPGGRRRPLLPDPPAPEPRALPPLRALAAAARMSLFVGRLARYQYLNMDQVVGAALAAFDRWAALDSRRRPPALAQAA